MEYKQRGKVNKFLDRRIGEDDANMSAEDKMLKRFALERSVSTTQNGSDPCRVETCCNVLLGTSERLFVF